MRANKVKTDTTSSLSHQVSRTYPVLWEEERLRSVFSTESRQKERGLFLQVHRPFNRIRVDFCKENGSGGAFISEGDLCSIIERGPLPADNRLFFVVGEAGSGKSELCQWIEYNINPDIRLPIHIPRSMTTAAHVTSLLREKLRARFPSSSLRHAPLVTQTKYIALSAIVLLYERGHHYLTQHAPAALWERVLMSDALAERVGTYLSASSRQVEWERLLDDNLVEYLCEMHGIAPDGYGSFNKVAHELRGLLLRSIDQAVWLGDLRDLLSRLSEQAVADGRRPLLLLEDITSFQLFGDLLLDYLLDLTSGHFDAVIGVTTGFERSQLAKASLHGDLTHVHHRLRGRFVLTDDTGRSYDLEEDVVDFARSYLRAVRSVPQHGRNASYYDAVFGRDLYPFTETALQRAFAHLHEEGNPRRTPRLFLEHVLSAALLGMQERSESPGVIPPVTLDRAAYLSRPPTLFRTDEVPDERLRSLLRWYGAVGDETVTLDCRIPAIWQVPVPDGLQQDGVVRVSRTYISRLPELPEIAPDWQQELRELQQWLATGGSYPSRETLKRGIERLLLNLGDPRSLASPRSLSVSKAEIYYARGDERLPIFLDGGSGDQPSGPAYLKVRVTRAPEERGLLEELAYFSLSGGELSQVCQNIAFALEWAGEHWRDYNLQVRALLTDRLGGLTPEHLVLISWRHLSSLAGEPPPINLSELPPTKPRSHVAPPYVATTPWAATQHRACYSAGENLFGWHDIARRLFIGMFTLRDTLIDTERYWNALDLCSELDALHRLASIDLRSVRSLPYKVRPGGHSLYDFLVPLQRYAQALINLNVTQSLQADSADLNAKIAKLEAQGTLDLSLLRRQLTLLRQRCGEVGVIWRDSWDTSLEALASISGEELISLGEVVRQLRQQAVNTLAKEVGASDVWAYQQFRHHLRPALQHPFWDAVDVLASIQAELLATARARYRRDGKLLYGTEAYRTMLSTVRSVRNEIKGLEDGQ